jgi:hypothetical protein
MAGIKAVKVEWASPPLECINGRWRGPPGAMTPRQDVDSGLHYVIACPGCGEIGTARDGAKWQVVSGNMDDVTTLTLTPSILKSCCGWHGYLRNGVFEAC